MAPSVTQQTKKPVSSCSCSCLREFCSARFLQLRLLFLDLHRTHSGAPYGLLGSLVPQQKPKHVVTAGNDDRHGPGHWTRLSVFWEMDLLLPVCKEAKSPQRTDLTEILV